MSELRKRIVIIISAASVLCATVTLAAAGPKDKKVAFDSAPVVAALVS
jgi:hypothetical protein